MDSLMISSHVETIREEIKRIMLHELFYRKIKRPTAAERAAHDNRQSRMLEIQVVLRKLRL